MASARTLLTERWTRGCANRKHKCGCMLNYTICNPKICLGYREKNKGKVKGNNKRE